MMDSPTSAELPGKEIEPWQLKARNIVVRGPNGLRPLTVYSIGALALALNRQVVTLRKWEREGYLPAARLKHQYGTRYYTEFQIRGLVELAKKYGVYDPRFRRTVPDEFAREARELFRSDPTLSNP